MASFFSASLPAPTGNAAVIAHDDDLFSVLAREEARLLLAQPAIDHDFGYPTSHRVGYWSPVSAGSWEVEGLGHEPEACHLDEEVSEEETESEDELRPSQRAMKKPVGAWGPAGSGRGEGERSSSEGVPIADTPEEQEEEEDEEYEDEDDDEYAPAAAPARPIRRVAGGQQPARISAAPAPAIASRKSTAWSTAEDAVCIKLMKEVCTQAQYAAIARTEKRFEVVADRMGEAGFVRTASGVKLQWNRRLRKDSKFEDRGEKKRASGLTTSALRQGTKRGTLAVTSLVATPSEGSSSSSRKGKRKAIYIDSDNENDDDDDDDFLSAPRPSKPAKCVRSTSVASSSAVPSTQDVAYYDLSTDNIITGSRASRQRRAPSITTTPARSSRSKPVSTISNDDNDDDEQEVIPAPKPSTRSTQLKRARIIDDDDEDEEPSTAAPQPKRKRMSDFTPVNKYSKKDDRLLDRNNKSDYIEYINSTLHYTRPISPEPAYNSKAYWQKVLDDRKARVAREREEAERQRQAEEEEEEEEDDEDPIITTADRAKKSRELRRQNAGTNGISTIRSLSPVEPSPPVESSSPIKPSSITKPSSATKPASTTTKFSIDNPFGLAKPPTFNRAPTFARPAPLNRPSPFSRPPLFSRPSSSSAESSSNTRPSSATGSSLTGRLVGSTISRSSTRPSSTTTSSPSVDNDRSSTQRDPRRQQTSSYRRLG
jgi:hypothetical protein